MKVSENKIYDPKTECMDRSEIRALQSERLRRTVEHVYQNVPLYRKRMDEAGVKPEDIHGIEDLHLLPFTNKTDLRDEFPYGLLAVPPRRKSYGFRVLPAQQESLSSPAIPKTT